MVHVHGSLTYKVRAVRPCGNRSTLVEAAFPDNRVASHRHWDNVIFDHLADAGPALLTGSPTKGLRVQPIEQQVANTKVDRSNPNWRTRLQKPTLATFDPARRLFAVMKTNQGTVGIRLFTETAPMHATSFAYLVGLGFYDGLAFHRIIDSFMAQGGCPLGSGVGGPGYKLDGEYAPSVRHDKPGLLSAANAGPGTDGSQFFLTFVPTPWLDGKHTIFGAVEEGLEILQALEAAGSPEGRPRIPVFIESVRLEERA